MNQREVEISVECRACLDAWNRLDEGGIPDDVGAARVAEFTESVEAFLDYCSLVPARQRLGELNLIWHRDAWQGDVRVGTTSVSDDIERMISITIEEITGVPREPIRTSPPCIASDV